MTYAFPFSDDRTPFKTILFCLGCLSALGMAPVYAWPVMMIGYAFLICVLSIKAKSWKQAGVYTFLFFFGYFLTGLYWVSSSLFVEFDQWWWALPLSFAGLPFILAVFPAVLVSLVMPVLRRFSAGSAIKIIAFAFTLALADYLRGTLFTGFPWNLPVHAFVESSFIMTALLPSLGFYGTNSFIILFLSAPLVILFCSLNVSRETIVKHLVMVIWGIGIALIIFYKPARPAETFSPHMPIIMVQGNIAQKDKWDREKIWDNFQSYITLSQRGIQNDQPHLVIWPETAIAQRLINTAQGETMFRAFLQSLPEGSQLITGILRHDGQHYYNSLAIFNRDAEIIENYDKHHLVPFGEYMPLGIDTITGFSGFSAGRPPAPLQNSILGEIQPLICYESIFASYTSSDDILLNITNDAWFGVTAGPYQHFDHLRFRAAEHRIAALRLSGNGLSGVIRPDGSIQNLSFLNRQNLIMVW